MITVTTCSWMWTELEEAGCITRADRRAWLEARGAGLEARGSEVRLAEVAEQSSRVSEELDTSTRSEEI